MSDLEIAARYAWAMLSTWPMKDAREKQHRNDVVLALERGLNIKASMSHVDETEAKAQAAAAWERACAVAGAERRKARANADNVYIVGRLEQGVFLIGSIFLDFDAACRRCDNIIGPPGEWQVRGVLVGEDWKMSHVFHSRQITWENRTTAPQN